jgi:hypothetical protein
MGWILPPRADSPPLTGLREELRGSGRIGFLANARKLAVTNGDEVHQYKLTAAALEEANVGGEWARPYMCAALAMNMTSPKHADSARLQRIADAQAVASTR